MAQLDIQETFKKMAILLESYGVQAHSESRAGESCLRLQAGRKLTDNPKSTLQEVGAFVVLNLPGNWDNTVSSGADLIGLGNSSQSPGSSTP